MSVHSSYVMLQNYRITVHIWQRDLMMCCICSVFLGFLGLTLMLPLCLCYKSERQCYSKRLGERWEKWYSSFRKWCHKQPRHPSSEISFPKLFLRFYLKHFLAPTMQFFHSIIVRLIYITLWNLVGVWLQVNANSHTDSNPCCVNDITISVNNT